MAGRFYCDCGQLRGDACGFDGDASDMVVVEYMPVSCRASHEAAGGSGGIYPHDGSGRVAMSRECAEELAEDPEHSGWVEILPRLDVADYGTPRDEEEDRPEPEPIS